MHLMECFQSRYGEIKEVLNGKEVHTVLIDLKLWPRTRDERRAFDEIFDSVTTYQLTECTLNFEQFSTMVHRLMKVFGEYRQDYYSSLFHRHLPPGKRVINDAILLRINQEEYLHWGWYYFRSQDARDKCKSIMDEFISLYGREFNLEEFTAIYGA